MTREKDFKKGTDDAHEISSAPSQTSAIATERPSPDDVARWTAAWVERIRVDGNWNRPVFWTPEEIDNAPWGREVVMQALHALLRVYDVRATRQIFATKEPNGLWYLLGNPWGLERSPLFILGYDLVTADAFEQRSLLDRLRKPEQYEGARLELALLAALRRASASLSSSLSAARAAQTRTLLW